MVTYKMFQLFEVYVDDKLYSLFAYSKDGAIRKAQKHFPLAKHITLMG